MQVYNNSVLQWALRFQSSESSALTQIRLTMLAYPKVRVRGHTVQEMAWVGFQSITGTYIGTRTFSYRWKHRNKHSLGLELWS